MHTVWDAPIEEVCFPTVDLLAVSRVEQLRLQEIFHHAVACACYTVAHEAAGLLGRWQQLTGSADPSKWFREMSHLAAGNQERTIDVVMRQVVLTRGSMQKELVKRLGDLVEGDTEMARATRFHIAHELSDTGLLDDAWTAYESLREGADAALLAMIDDQQGAILLRRGDAEGALALHTRAREFFKLSPGSADSATNQRRMANAVAALDRHSEAAHWHFQSAQDCVRLGRLHEARDSLIHSGWHLLQDKRYGDALDAYTSALTLDRPEVPRCFAAAAHHGAAVAALGVPSYSVARHHLRQLLSLAEDRESPEMRQLAEILRTLEGRAGSAADSDQRSL